MNSLTITWGGGSAATYSGYTTTCAGASTALEQTEEQPVVRKIIRNGQLLIIRDGEIYTITGIKQ